LAQRTQDSTKEIDDIISMIISGANSSVDQMANSVTQASYVQENAKMVIDLNQIITGDMNEISDLSAKIATAAEEQSVVVNNILQNIETLNTGITQTSQAGEHIAESSIELAHLATELEKESSEFKIE
ncbi:MAG: methyl-accepting chemotaxis protein, partial [Candidatus Brocadiaceae bacterium]|nr:methyl-accepting chemotaxis protein [Candidatus Brocadiaceae bacterium]